MFFKKFRKSFKTFLLFLLIVPTNILAYSKFVIPGGENIGISINTKGIVVVGTYEINGKDIAAKAGLKTGDIITKIDDKKVSSIDELVNTISKGNETISVTYLRNEKENQTQLDLIKEDGVFKTGLYVKDNITGIGTLSYIDPETSIFGALGHEVIESNSGEMLEVKDGKIVSTTVTNIDRSETGNPGSKNANINLEDVNGEIKENTSSGVFGIYTEQLPNKELKEVADSNAVKKGKAQILTVINNDEIKEYEINILKIDKNNNGKNILFEVTDQELLDRTGGIVQGMSGSPIIQNDLLIGAVTHVVVDNPKRGYGIFITNMLEEGEN